MKRTFSAFVTILIALAGLLVLSGPARAAGTDGTAPNSASAPSVYDAWYRIASGPQESGGCRVDLDGPIDPLLVCGSYYTIVNWTDGRWEVFGLGTDRQIWHTYQTAPGSAYTPWYSMGGYQLNAYGVTLWDYTPTLYVYGQDLNPYCKRYNGNGWDNWAPCA